MVYYISIIFFFFSTCFARSDFNQNVYKQTRKVSALSDMDKREIDKIHRTILNASTFQDCTHLYRNQLIQNIVNIDDSYMQTALYTVMYTTVLNSYEKQLLAMYAQVVSAKEYWQHYAYIIKKSWYSRGINNWYVSTTERRKIKKSLAIVAQVEQNIGALLGIAQNYIQVMEQSQDIESMQEVLANGVHELADYIHVDITHMTMLQSLEAITQKMQIIYQQSAGLLSSCAKPWFMQRNKIGLGLFGITAASIVSWLYTYKDDIPGWQQRAAQTSASLYQTQIVEPIDEITELFWHNRDRNAIAVPEFVALPEKSLSPGVFAELGFFEKVDHVRGESWLASLPVWGRSSDNVRRVLEQIPAFVQACSQVEENINEGYRALVHDMNVSMGFVQNIAASVEQVRKQQNVTFLMAAMLPACLVAGALGYLGHRVYTSIKSKMSWHQHLRDVMRHIERALNRALHQENVTYELQGKIYFWLYQLRAVQLKITGESGYMLDQDITELLSDQLSYQQKLNIVYRMYHTYSFLQEVE